jgi:hypothetical protein
MGTNGWLEPGTCGVQLGKFNQLADMMSRSGPELEQLAQQLYRALATAGVDTTPAMEISRIAKWANEVGPDLKRRNQLAHDLDRQKLAMVACVADGMFIKLPDRYSDQQGQVSGYQAADLFKQAMNGDRGALADLLRYQDYATNPWFAKALLEKLGPIDFVKLPVQLARLLRGDINDHSKNLNVNAEDTRAALALLGKALAVGTRPLTNGYTGDQFLKELQTAGRTGFPPGGPNYVGYQGLSAILEATGGTVRYSEAFMRTVGRDMIDHARANEASGWKPTPDVADLTDIGTLLDQPGHADSSTGDYLTGLLTVAGATRESSQALLDHTPPGAKTTNLYYLLHDRREAWGATDRGAALGQTIKAATVGHDDVSDRLFIELYRTLGKDILQFVHYKTDNTLGIPAGTIGKLRTDDDRAKLDQLSGLRSAIGDVLLSRIDDISLTLYGDDLAGASDEDDRLLTAMIADAVQNDHAFDVLVKGQIGSLKIWLDQQQAKGKDITVGLASGASFLGLLLAFRKEMMTGRSAGERASNDDLKGLIDMGLGYLDPTMQLEKVGLSPEVAGYLGGRAFDEMSKQLVEQLGNHQERDGGNTAGKVRTDEDAIIKLIKQMLISSTLAHLPYEPSDVASHSFAKDGKILPPETWTKTQRLDFIKWAKVKGADQIDMSNSTESMIEGLHDKSIQALEDRQ